MGRPRRRSGRLLMLLFLFFFSILAVIFFQSSLSKIQRISIEGVQLLSREEVEKQSGIILESQILNLSPEEIKSRLLELPQIKSVTVTRNFPGEVKIQIEENKVVAYLLKNGMDIYPILENGHVLSTKTTKVANYPIITSWPENQSLANISTELSKLNFEIYQEISEIIAAPSENDPYKIILYMRDGYEVRTTSYDLAKYLWVYPAIISSLEADNEQEKPGVIHLSDAGQSYISYEAMKSKSEESEGTDPS